MLRAVRRLIADVVGDRVQAESPDEIIHLAAAALLFHVVAVDGVVTEEERQTLIEELTRRFDLDRSAAQSLVERGERAEDEAVDLYRFTSTLKARLDQGARERLVETMWRLVYADGAVHEFEENAVWRIAELLAVPTQTRLRLKQSARNNAR